MAIAPVAFIAPPENVKNKKAHKGGFGGVATQAGAAIGAVAGGMSTGGAGAVQGGAAGASLGGLVGEMVDPSKAASSVMAQRAQTQAPQMIQSETSAKLKDSIIALQKAPDPIRVEYSKPLVTAYMHSIAKDNGGQV